MLFKAFIKRPAGVCWLLPKQIRWLRAIHAKLQFTKNDVASSKTKVTYYVQCIYKQLFQASHH